VRKIERESKDLRVFVRESTENVERMEQRNGKVFPNR